MSGFYITLPIVRGLYELLRTTPPFRGWRLPPSDEVEIHVISSRKFGADYIRKANGVHRIRINASWMSTLNSLTRALAHEMTHMHCDIECPGDTAHHGARFNKAAKIVCRYHCWDVKSF